MPEGLLTPGPAGRPFLTLWLLRRLLSCAGRCGADVHATAGMIVSEGPAPRYVGSGLLLL